MDRGTWKATTHRVTKSWAQLSDLTTKIKNKQTNKKKKKKKKKT